jgi:hypothetical protein
MAKQVLKVSHKGANDSSLLSRNDKLMLGRQTKQVGWDVINFTGKVADEFVFNYEPTKSGERKGKRLIRKALKTNDPKDIQRVLVHIDQYAECVDVVEPPLQVLPAYDKHGWLKKSSKKRSTWGAKQRKKQLVQEQPEDTQRVASTEHSQRTVVQQAAAGSSFGDRNDTSVNANTASGREHKVERKCEHFKTVKKHIPIVQHGQGRDRSVLISNKPVKLKLVCIETATMPRQWQGNKQWVCSKHGKVRTHTGKEQDELTRNKMLWV